MKLHRSAFALNLLILFILTIEAQADFYSTNIAHTKCEKVTTPLSFKKSIEQSISEIQATGRIVKAAFYKGQSGGNYAQISITTTGNKFPSMEFAYEKEVDCKADGYDIARGEILSMKDNCKKKTFLKDSEIRTFCNYFSKLMF